PDRAWLPVMVHSEIESVPADDWTRPPPVSPWPFWIVNPVTELPPGTDSVVPAALPSRMVSVASPCASRSTGTTATNGPTQVPAPTSTCDPAGAASSACCRSVNDTAPSTVARPSSLVRSQSVTLTSPQTSRAPGYTLGSASSQSTSAGYPSPS